MTDDAPATECAYEDCWCEPSVDAWVVLKAREHKRAIASAPLGVAICAEHAKETTFASLVTDDVWDDICSGFTKSGRVAPDRSLSSLDLLPRERKEWA